MNIQEIHNKVLILYVDKSSDKEYLSHPFTQKGSIYATNRFSAIRIKGLSEDYEELEKPRMPELFEFNGTEERFSFENIFEKANKAPMVAEYEDSGDIECTECDGEGQVEWEYKDWTKMFDCPKCDGEGYEEGKPKPTGRMIKDPNFIVHIGCLYFKFNHIVALLTTMELLKSDNVVLKRHESRCNVVFTINKDVSVVVMPTQKL